MYAPKAMNRVVNGYIKRLEDKVILPLVLNERHLSTISTARQMLHLPMHPHRNENGRGCLQHYYEYTIGSEMGNERRQ